MDREWQSKYKQLTVFQVIAIVQTSGQFNLSFQTLLQKQYNLFFVCELNFKIQC